MTDIFSSTFSTENEQESLQVGLMEQAAISQNVSQIRCHVMPVKLPTNSKNFYNELLCILNNFGLLQTSHDIKLETEIKYK